MKDVGLENGLMDLIAADPAFGLNREERLAHMEPSRCIGRCPEQVAEFCPIASSRPWSVILRRWMVRELI